MAWKSPTSAGGSGWENTSYLYDEDINTWVINSNETGWSGAYLTANYSGGLWCSKVRIYIPLSNPDVSQINIDVYYDDVWHDVYQGSFSDDLWTTYWLPKIAFVTLIRIKLYSSAKQYHKVAEVDFWEVEEDAPTYDNCVAFYKLNDKLDTNVVLDSSGNEHHGTVVNDQHNYSSEQHIDGKINGAFEFDGTNDYIDCGDDDDFSFGNGSSDSPFSISLWAYPDTAINFSMVKKIGASSYEYVLYGTGTPRLLFALRDYSTGGKIGRYPGNLYLNDYDGQWIHIVATYDGSGSYSGLKLYIGGVRVDDTNWGSGTYVAMENTTNPVQIGSACDGKMDAVMLFDKELTENEVGWLYNRGRGKENLIIPRHAMEKY